MRLVRKILNCTTFILYSYNALLMKFLNFSDCKLEMREVKIIANCLENLLLYSKTSSS